MVEDYLASFETRLIATVPSTPGVAQRPSGREEL